MEQGKGFVELLQELRDCLPTPEYLITTALTTGEYALKNIDLRSAAHHLDYLNLMGYDFMGGWTEVAGNHAQLHAPKPKLLHRVLPDLQKSGARGVQYVLGRGFPNEKILLCIPSYARHFPRATAAGQPSFSTAGEVDYSEMPGNWIASALVDTHLVAATIVDPVKGFASFDVPRTVTLKAQYANAMKLGGLFYWTGVADREGAQSLVDAGYHELMARYSFTS